MSTLDRIVILLNRQGKKQKDLTDYLGISKNAFTDWKSGRIKSYNKHLPKIAEFLNVSTDYLLGREENNFETKKEPPIMDSSNEQITQILSIIDELPTEKLDSVLDYLRFLNQSET